MALEDQRRSRSMSDATLKVTALRATTETAGEAIADAVDRVKQASKELTECSNDLRRTVKASGTLRAVRPPPLPSR